MAKILPVQSSIVKMAGCWDVWENAEQEYLIHWRFLTKHFGVDTLYMTPVTGLAEKLKSSLDYTESTFIELPSLEDVIKANPELTPVIVDENGVTELSSFVHPDKVLYLFGRVGYSPLESLKKQSVSVRIPSWSKKPNVSRGLLHPHQAATVVLYDKMTKLWQSHLPTIA